MTKEIYTHRFAGGITATATVDGAPGQPGFKVEWSEFPPPVELIPEYLFWRQAFMAEFARKTGQKILVVDLALKHP